MNQKLYSISKVLLSLIIGIDIISIFTSIVFKFSVGSFAVVAFDVFVCAVLLFDFLQGYLGSSNRLVYLQED